MTPRFGGLAATGSDVTPWLLVAGIIVLLGVIALIVAGVARSRRAERQVEDAATKVTEAGGALPEPDPNAPASDETVIEEASELDAAPSAGEVSSPGAAPGAGEVSSPGAAPGAGEVSESRGVPPAGSGEEPPSDTGDSGAGAGRSEP